MGVGVILSILWRLRGVIAVLLALAALWGAYHWFQGVLQDRRDLQVAVAQAEEQTAKAVAVNQDNTRAMKELKLDVDLERALTAKEIKKTAERLAASNQLIREMRDVEGANDPVSPYWAEYFNRVRGADSHRTPNH